MDGCLTIACKDIEGCDLTKLDDGEFWTSELLLLSIEVLRATIEFALVKFEAALLMEEGERLREFLFVFAGLEATGLCLTDPGDVDVILELDKC